MLKTSQLVAMMAGMIGGLGNTAERLASIQRQGNPKIHGVGRGKRVGSDRSIFTKFSQCKYFFASREEIQRRIDAARKHNERLAAGVIRVSRSGKTIYDYAN